MVGEGKLRVSHRVNLESRARQGDPAARWELDNQPECPRLAAHLWTYFLELDQTRSSNGMATCRLTRIEIRQWERDARVSLDDWERRALIAVDAAFTAGAQAEPDQVEEA